MKKFFARPFDADTGEWHVLWGSTEEPLWRDDVTIVVLPDEESAEQLADALQAQLDACPFAPEVLDYTPCGFCGETEATHPDPFGGADVCAGCHDGLKVRLGDHRPPHSGQ